MPIYEFYCPDNHRIYSFFARSLRLADKIPRCPDNPKWRMEKMLSSFAVTGGASEPDAGGGDSSDDARMDAAMNVMEREFGSLADSDNPDPRAVAKMMRRMGELTGGRMPGQMEEMLARMEKGEDLEKLEEEYGDAMEGMEDFGMCDEEGPGPGKRGPRKRRAATRDPKMYEMSDWVDGD
ncbi:MAG: hypothetical protein RL088_186 [Verrucomicrobiota bacterium]|jgi:hypothetical protein